ncbi:pilus assembly protein [Photobacterium damselae]|uniref:pilus assembly protein n=1 Tax=Photobacterium damselae TaxID=38293 RepID=UPI0040681191
MKKTLFMVAFISLYSTYTNAIAVSSLFEAADAKTHSADIIIENNDGKDMFINIEMSKVDYIDGKKIVTKVDRNNIKNWTFSVNPTQLVLKPNERKTIRLHNKCSNKECKLKKDKVYAVDITPVPYVEGKVSAVAVAFGYRVYFMDPATEVNLKYKIKRLSKDKFVLTNHSNTMLRAIMNACSSEYNSDCIFDYRVLAGASKEFYIPKKLRNKSSLKVNIINANEEINESVSI